MITGYEVRVSGVIKARCATENEAVSEMVAQANVLRDRCPDKYVLTRYVYRIGVSHVALQSRFDVRVCPIAACPCCGAKLSTFWQAGENGSDGYWAGTCSDEACLLINRTLPLEQFEVEATLAFQRDEARKTRQRDAQRRSRMRRAQQTTRMAR